MNLLTKVLKDYLECASIYRGTSPKKKTDLIEMIVYGYMTVTLNKKDLKDIPIKQENQILINNYITINSLPGHGNIGLKKKNLNHMSKKKYFLMLVNKIAPLIDNYFS